jgi:hypothetical protein
VEPELVVVPRVPQAERRKIIEMPQINKNWIPLSLIVPSPFHDD